MSAIDPKQFTAIPESLLERSKAISIVEKRTVVQENVNLYYQDTGPVSEDHVPVLFLHGASFKSQTWRDLNTLALVGAMGYRAIAINLPGYGCTAESHSVSKNNFIHHVVKELAISRPIVVSPSMSGGYSVPYIMREVTGSTSPETAGERTRGYIPVSPVGLSLHKSDEYSKLKIPIMVVYGTQDQHPMKEESIKAFSGVPSAALCPMEGAGHACYMNKPDEWHRLLYNFLTNLQKA